jgi:hypothetical protein
MWVPRGSEESIIFIRFIVLLFPPPQCPPPQKKKVVENGVAGQFCIAVLFTGMLKNCKKHSESSFLGGFDDGSFSSIGISWTDNRHLKPQKIIKRFLVLLSFLWIVFAFSKGHYSTQNRSRKLKFISLEMHGNGDSEYVFKTVIAYLRIKQQNETSNQFIKSLCDKIGLHWVAMLLMSQRNVNTSGTQPVESQWTIGPVGSRVNEGAIQYICFLRWINMVFQIFDTHISGSID